MTPNTANKKKLHNPVFKIMKLVFMLVLFTVLSSSGITSKIHIKKLGISDSINLIENTNSNEIKENTGEGNGNEAPASDSKPPEAVLSAYTDVPNPPAAPSEAAAQTPAPVQVVTPRKAAIWGNREKPEVALTIDDGYDRQSIIRTLDILRKAQLKCTFFVIGIHMRDYPDLWRQAVNDGHQVCNHTYSHKSMANMSDDAIRAEIDTWEQTAIEILGQDYFDRMKRDFPLMRLPGGSGQFDERVLKVVAEKGYIPIGWSLETYDSVIRHHNLNVEPADQVAGFVVNHVVSNAANGSIILIHFVPSDTLRLQEILDGIAQKGLSIKQVTEVIK